MWHSISEKEVMKGPIDSPKDNLGGVLQGPWTPGFLFHLIVILQFVSLSAGLGTCRWEKSQESPPMLFSTSGTRI